MSYTKEWFQDHMWVAIYKDGTKLYEIDAAAGKPLNKFQDIDKDKLQSFHLINGKNDYCFNCETGVFSIDGKEVYLPQKPEGDYADGIILFKEGAQHAVFGREKTHPYENFGILSYNIGYKTHVGDIVNKVIFTVDVARNTKFLTVSTTVVSLDKKMEYIIKL